MSLTDDVKEVRDIVTGLIVKITSFEGVLEQKISEVQLYKETHEAIKTAFAEHKAAYCDNICKPPSKDWKRTARIIGQILAPIVTALVGFWCGKI